jgi:hypothetical protein
MVTVQQERLRAPPRSASVSVRHAGAVQRGMRDGAV